MTAKPLTDDERQILGGYDIKPHPDGKPWSKCCTGPYDTETKCRCFMKKPKRNKSRFDLGWADGELGIRLKNLKQRFFCVHRETDDGYHRECAGWAAKITGNRP